MDIYQPKVVKAVAVNRRAQAGQLLGSSSALPVGFHFVVDRRNLEPIQEVFGFLLAQNVSRLGKTRLRNQENTSKANAEDLVDLLLFANSVQVRLVDFTEELIQSYADSMSQTISPQTQKVYSDATILKRVSTAKRALEYLQNQGQLRNRIEARRVVVDGEPKTIFAPSVNLPKAPAVDALVRHISPKYIDEIGTELGSMPSEGGMGSSRNRLVFNFLINTGCRISEALSCNCSDLPLQQIGMRDPLEACFIKVAAKGGHKRNVRLPVWLLEELSLYIIGERALAISRLSSDEVHDKIFANKADARREAGRPLTPSNYRRIMRVAALRAAERLGSRYVPGPHSCRHSFALFNYAVEKLNGNADPGKTVQALLGHKDRSTTDRIYLNASVMLEEALSERDQSHLTKLLGEHGL